MVGLVFLHILDNRLADDLALVVVVNLSFGHPRSDDA